MGWRDVLVLGFFGFLSVFSIAGALWAWRADRYGSSDRHLRWQLAMFPFVNPSTVPIALLLTDVFLLFVGITIAGSAGNTLTAVTLAALLPLLVLCFTAWHLRWPAVLVPPWARGRPPARGPSEQPVAVRRSASARVKEGFMTIIGSLGVVVIIFGGIWFFAVPEADRYWGLLAAVIGLGALVVGSRRKRGSRRDDG